MLGRVGDELVDDQSEVPAPLGRQHAANRIDPASNPATIEMGFAQIAAQLGQIRPDLDQPRLVAFREQSMDEGEGRNLADEALANVAESGPRGFLIEQANEQRKVIREAMICFLHEHAFPGAAYDLNSIQGNLPKRTRVDQQDHATSPDAASWS
jgi:hypothetical protein